MGLAGLCSGWGGGGIYYAVGYGGFYSLGFFVLFISPHCYIHKWPIFSVEISKKIASVKRKNTAVFIPPQCFLNLNNTLLKS